MITAIERHSGFLRSPSNIDGLVRSASDLLGRVAHNGELHRRLTKAANMSVGVVRTGGRIVLVGRHFGLVSRPATVEISTRAFYEVSEVDPPVASDEAPLPPLGLPHLSSKDMLMTFSTELARSAVEPAVSYAKKCGACTVAFVGGDTSAEFAGLFDNCIFVPVLGDADLRLGMNLLAHTVWVEAAEVLYKKVY